MAQGFAGFWFLGFPVWFLVRFEASFPVFPRIGDSLSAIRMPRQWPCGARHGLFWQAVGQANRRDTARIRVRRMETSVTRTPQKAVGGIAGPAVDWAWKRY